MLVLSEITLENWDLENVDIVKIYGKDIQKHEGSEAEVIICCRATARIVSEMNFPKLKLVQLTSAGFDGVPIELYRQKGIYVANAGSVYSIPIAETVIYGMLQMAKRYHENPQKHRIRIARNYKYITELYGKTVTILGTGSIGGEIAKRLQGFEMKTYGFSKSGRQKEYFAENTNRLGRLKEMLGESQFVISTLPDQADLKGFINAELISCMKSDCVLLNVGRNMTINKRDLFRALKTRQIGGAVLDMFEKVPNPITNIFRRLSNTIVWPGVSAISREVSGRLEEHAKSNILKTKKTEEPNCVVNGGTDAV